MSHHTVQGQNGHGAWDISRGKAQDTDGRQLDAGMHPAYEGLSAMPFYDEFDLSTVDVLLISQ